MKRKPIRIDWDDLEAAFDNKDAELVYYLDRVTGHVVLEGQDADDEEAPYDHGAPPRQNDPFHTYIEPLTSDQKLEWLERFVQEATDLEPEFVSSLDAAMDQDDPVPAVIEVLNGFPDGKDQWYVCRTERLHEVIDAWLARHGIDFTDPPPWK